MREPKGRARIFYGIYIYIKVGSLRISLLAGRVSGCFDVFTLSEKRASARKTFVFLFFFFPCALACFCYLPLMNANVSPLGGKTSLGKSPVVARELARFNAFKADVLALGPVNNEAASLAYRRALVRDNAEYAALFASLNLSV